MATQFEKLMEIVETVGMSELNDFLAYDMNGIQRMLAGGTPITEINNPFLSFVGEMELLDSYGGEGDGDRYWKVFRLGGHTYQLDAYYTSWDGTDFDSAEIYEVEPREVVKIEYSRKK